MAHFRKEEKFIGFMFCALLLFPLLIYYSFDGVDMPGQVWLSQTLPKMDADFDQMKKFYGETAARDLQRFFTITVYTNLIGIVLMAVVFFVQYRKGRLCTGLRASSESSLRGTNDEKLFLGVLFFLGLFAAAMAWILPSLIAKPNGWGPFTVQAGLRGQIITVIWFAGAGCYIVPIIASFIEIRINTNE